tara:strand:- start:334 stop:585 length:252 start_codon:yes stop_codon:yes gene_type:complete
VREKQGKLQMWVVLGEVKEGTEARVLGSLLEQRIKAMPVVMHMKVAGAVLVVVVVLLLLVVMVLVAHNPRKSVEMVEPVVLPA